MNIEGVYNRVKDLQRRLEIIPHAVSDVVSRERNTLLALKKDTMLLGRNDEDMPFTPGYMEDTYFKTPIAARNYYEWKQGMRAETRSLLQYLTDQPEKNSDTPDLFVTGLWTYDPAVIRTSSDSFSIINPHVKGGDIWRKYHLGDGISPIARQYFWENFLLSALRRHIWGK